MAVTIDWNLLDTWGQVQDWFKNPADYLHQYTGPELPTDPISLWRFLASRQEGTLPS